MTRRCLPYALALVALSLPSACARRASTTPEPPPTSYRAPGPGATHYTSTGQGAALRGPHASRVGRGVQRAAEARNHPLEPDGRLGQLAAWVAQNLDAGGAPPPYAAIELWTRHLGLFEPTPHLIVLAQPDASTLEERIATEVDALLPQQRYTHYGAFTAQQAGGAHVVLALSWRWANLRPVPRAVAPGQSVTLAGRLLPGLSGAQLVVSYPDGTSERGQLDPRPAFRLVARTRGRGLHRVELLSTSHLGTTVVANFPLYVGVTPDASVTAMPGEHDEGELDAGEVQARLLELINRDRARAGAAPLELDEELSELALAHSHDMHANGFVGHTSPTHGSAADRVARAGVRTPLVLENIGRGYGPSEIHRGLMDSPGHRDNVLSADATHVGIGVLPAPEDDRTAYLVTEVFVRLAREIDVGEAPAQLLEAVNRERSRRGVRPLQHDTQLSALCAATAAEYFTAPPGASRQRMTERLNRQAAQRPGSYTRIAALMAVVTDMDEAAGLAALHDKVARGVGIGIAQGTREDTIENAIVVVVLLGY